MRILVISQYFWPEPFIINDLVGVLSTQGHQLTVFTGKPNYPEGKVYPGYQVRHLQCELFREHVSVYRVPLRPRRSAGSFDLVLNYLSFIFSGLRYFPRLARHQAYDAILVFAPSPITSAIPAILLKWLKQTHLAIWVQDLWPESLAATGHVRHSWLLKAMGGLVRLIYRCADTLLIQSHAFYAPVARLAAIEKIVYYPNSIDIAPFRKTSEQALPGYLMNLLESRFCMVFAGNIGKAQAMTALVEAARLLENSEITIVLVGSGSQLGWVEEQKNILSLHNLVLAGRFPMQIMPEIYRRAAGLIVTLKRDDILRYTIPSKIQAYLAAGRPIIAALDGEGARIVEEAGAGYTCAAEDGVALAANVVRLYKTSPEARAEMGSNGYRYFMKNFEMSRQADNLVHILSARIKRQGEH